jgi:outer membrane protein
LFFSHRFEGFPYDRVPVSLAGMTGRDPGADFGLSYEQRFSWGNVFGEALHDISGVSRGGELRVGYTDRWTFGRWRLAPLLMVAARDAKLNDYYYGVSAEEAQPDRPEYHPRSGFNATAGLNLRYDLTERWRFVAGLSATRWASGVHHSPIVDNRPQFGGFGGFAYDFTPGPEMPRGDDAPLIIKLLHGGSTDCNMVPIMRLSCTSTSAADGTGVDAIEIGRPFIERANGWPLDFVGYAGALLHDENKLQPDFWQLNLYVKLFYYGFPWDNRVRTRVGFGAGISYARQVPFVEARDQADRGRNTSKLLSYLDPSIDVSLGDLMAVPEWRETYVGFGVSHRSGIFGMSSLLGNVNGGSNYIYTYIEWKM